MSSFQVNNVVVWFGPRLGEHRHNMSWKLGRMCLFKDVLALKTEHTLCPIQALSCTPRGLADYRTHGIVILEYGDQLRNMYRILKWYAACTHQILIQGLHSVWFWMHMCVCRREQNTSTAKIYLWTASISQHVLNHFFLWATCIRICAHEGLKLFILACICRAPSASLR